MLKTNHAIKLLISAILPVILTGALLAIFTFSGIRVFQGDRNQALGILNALVQGLSTIVAIVFSIIFVVVQINLGKYFAKIAWYLIFDWVNILMLTLYVSTIVVAMCAMSAINAEYWTVLIDTSIVASVVCVGCLLPFFLRMSTPLNPTLIMNQAKDEILNAFKRKNYHLMEDKIALLSGIVQKSVEMEDIEYAYYGLGLVEDILAKTEHVLSTSIDLHEFAYETADSIVAICRKASGTKFAIDLIPKGFGLVIDLYRSCAMSNLFLDRTIRELLRICKEDDIYNRTPVCDETNTCIKHLLRKGNHHAALMTLAIVLDEIPASREFRESVTRLIEFAKAESFDNFVSESLKIVKQKFAS